MAFGPHRNRELGILRETTLNRIKLLVERDLQRADMFDELRTVAQSYLKFTPPSFPNIRSQGLTPGQKQKLEQDYIQALEDFGYLSAIENEPLLLDNLAEAERQLFRELQRRAYAATNQASYIALRWNRADGCVRHRECALVYDPVKRRYLFLAYLLADGSRHKQTLTVDGDLYDVNNPGISNCSRLG